MRQATPDAPHCLKPDSGHSGRLLLVILLGLGLSIAAGVMSSREMLRSAPLAAAPAPQVPGSTLEAVVQVTALGGSSLEVRLLERNGQDYAPTARRWQANLTPDTRYLMGSRADLKPGAVLQLKGVLQDAAGQRLQASEAVILTGYVQVTP